MTSVLGAASVGCATAAFGVLVHWVAHRKDGLGRDRDLPVVRVGALALLAVLAAVPGAQRAAEERRLGKIASVLAGHHVKVHCQDGAEAFVDAGSELGWVAFDANGIPQPKTLIKRAQCQYLKAYDKHPADPSWDEVVAVHVLTHESMHMRGERSESVAECEAVQRDAITAAAFGATPAQAHSLAVEYWARVYPNMPDDYRSGDCAPGGALDEHLASAPWAG